MCLETGRDNVLELDHLADVPVSAHPEHSVAVPVGYQEAASVWLHRVLHAARDEEVRLWRVPRIRIDAQHPTGLPVCDVQGLVGTDRAPRAAAAFAPIRGEGGQLADHRIPGRRFGAYHRSAAR